MLITLDGGGKVLNMQAVSRYMACKDSETEISREEEGWLGVGGARYR